jgi:integrase
MPAALWSSPIDTVTPPALLAALLAIRPHERARNLTKDERLAETVGRIRQRLEAIFEDAAFHGHCSGNPAAAIRRKLREATPRARQAGFRSLPFREAPAFVQALRQQEGTAARCLELLMLCAARTNEAIDLAVGELDLEAGRWVVPAEKMKGKEEHVVFLAPRAIELLKAQLAMKLHPRIVFPSPDVEGSPLSNMALLALLGRMGYRGRTTVHGLRATFSTWANETAAARPDVIECALAHEESNRVRAAYNRATFAQERRALLEAWADYLDKKPTSNVLPLKAA